MFEGRCERGDCREKWDEKHDKLFACYNRSLVSEPGQL